MTGSLWTKSKFMGMSIGVTMIGQLTLALPQYGEVRPLIVPNQGSCPLSVRGCGSALSLIELDRWHGHHMGIAYRHSDSAIALLNVKN